MVNQVGSRAIPTQSCTLLTTEDRRGRKQPASAGALNRPSKEKTAAVCGAMQWQCIVESISEEAAHQIGALYGHIRLLATRVRFPLWVSYPCLVPMRITSPSLSLLLDEVPSIAALQ